MLMGNIVSTSGRIKIGHNVEFAYYDQGQRLLNENNTVIEELQEAYHLYSEGELRNILGRFLFRGEDVFKEIPALSGGERARLSLLKMMMSGANTLVLDEPTNHLDIESKEIFEDALLEFPGTCIIVSHDRYFLNKIPTRIMELTARGLVNYPGRYDYYVEKKQELLGSAKQYVAGLSDRTAGAYSEGVRVLPEENKLSSAEQRKLQKQREAEERRLQRHKESLENAIEKLEEEISKIEADLSREEIINDHEKLAKLALELKERKETLDKNYDDWLELQG